MALISMDKIDFKFKRVLVRIDVNAAVEKGKVIDGPRFTASAETIKELIKKKARVVLIAHQGRKGDEDFLPLMQHAAILKKHVGKPIKYVDDVFGEKARVAILGVNSGEVLLLENVRTNDDETKLDLPNNRYPDFCKQFHFYINDAFSVSHREQGSITIPPKVLPSCMGRSLEREVGAITKFAPEQNLNMAYVVGGSKIDDYIPLLNALERPNTKLLASGVFGNLFLIAQGKDLGYESKWMKEKGFDKLIPQLKEALAKYKDRIILPDDFAFGDKKRVEAGLDKAPFKDKIWDVGHLTVEKFKREIAGVKAVFMKGPLGYSEKKQFNYGTVEVLKHIAGLTKKKKLFSLLGGGHLTTAIDEYKLPKTFSYISLSGGALLASLAGKKLPGIEALKVGNQVNKSEDI